MEDETWKAFNVTFLPYRDFSRYQNIVFPSPLSPPPSLLKHARIDK